MSLSGPVDIGDRKLSACPHCGRSDRLKVNACTMHVTKYSVQCYHCGSSSGYTEGLEAVIRLWERRSDGKSSTATTPGAAIQ